MCKNDIEQNDFEKFVVFFFFETIEENYLKVSQIFTAKYYFEN